MLKTQQSCSLSPKMFIHKHADVPHALVYLACAACCICSTTRDSSRKLSLLYCLDIKALHPNDIGVVCRYIHHVVKNDSGQHAIIGWNLWDPVTLYFTIFLCECAALRNINSFLIWFIVKIITLLIDLKMIFIVRNTLLCFMVMIKDGCSPVDCSHNKSHNMESLSIQMGSIYAGHCPC